MEKAESKVVNSKSSNGALMDAAPKIPVRAPRRPCRGQKRFLASVLSLLSKSSTGTQYPNDGAGRLKISKTTKIPDIADIEDVSAKEPYKRKKKYRSKILNSRNYPPDTFEVLQSKKNIVTTPSIDFSDDNEEFEDIKWSEFLPRLVKPNSDEIQMEKDKKLKHLASKLAEGRIDGRKEKRVKIETDEPPTLVSENKKHTTKDPGFYNFFVDLLETTFDVYNIKSENDFHGMIPSVVSSKVNFEMDETVANKLNNVPLDISRQPSVISRNEMQAKQAEFQVYSSLRRSITPPLNKKNKYDYYPKYRNPKPKQPILTQSILPPPFFTKSASMPLQKSSYKKNSKQMLLNKLKEQLSMEHHPSDEPQNMFQALKILAKNKRKTEKTLRFDKTLRFVETMDEIAKDAYEYKKRRRYLALPKRSKIKNSYYKYVSRQPLDFKKWQKMPKGEVSNYSLEVVNMDYGYGRRGRPDAKRTTNMDNLSLLSYSPNSVSPSESVLDFCNDSLLPERKQIVMKVKSVRSQEFCCDRDEALSLMTSDGF